MPRTKHKTIALFGHLIFFAEWTKECGYLRFWPMERQYLSLKSAKIPLNIGELNGTYPYVRLLFGWRITYEKF